MATARDTDLSQDLEEGGIGMTSIERVGLPWGGEQYG